MTTPAATRVTGTTAHAQRRRRTRTAPRRTGWFRYATTNPGTCNDTFGTRAPATGGTSLGAGTSAGRLLAAAHRADRRRRRTTSARSPQNARRHGLRRGAVLHHARAARRSTTGGDRRSAAPPRRSTAPPTRTARDHRLVPLRHDQPRHLRRHLRHARPAAAAPTLGAGSTPSRTRRRSPASSAGDDLLLLRHRPNAAGTSFGAVLSFTTPAAPTVTTTAATLVTSTTATLNGSATRTARRPPAGSATAPPTRAPATTPSARARRAAAARGSAPAPRRRVRAGAHRASRRRRPTTSARSPEHRAAPRFGEVLSFTTRGAADVTTEPATGVTGTGAAQRLGQPATAPRHAAGSATPPTSPGTCNDTFGTRAPSTGGTASAPAPPPSPSRRRSPGSPRDDVLLLRHRPERGRGPRFGTVLSFTRRRAPTVTTRRRLTCEHRRHLNGHRQPQRRATTGWFRYGDDQPRHLRRHLRHPRARRPAASRWAQAPRRALLAAADGPRAGKTYYFCAMAQQRGRRGVRGGALLHHRRGAPDGEDRAPRRRHQHGGDAERRGEPQRRRHHRLVPLRHVDPAPATTIFGTRAPARWHRARLGQRGGAVLGGVTGLPAGHDLLLLRDRLERGRRARSAPCCTFTTTAITPVVTTSSVSGVTLTGGHAQRLGEPERDNQRLVAADAKVHFGNLLQQLRHPRPDGHGRVAPLGAGTAAVSFSAGGHRAVTPASPTTSAPVASNAAGTALRPRVLSCRVDAPSPTVSTESGQRRRGTPRPR